MRRTRRRCHGLFAPVVDRARAVLAQAVHRLRRQPPAAPRARSRSASTRSRPSMTSSTSWRRSVPARSPSCRASESAKTGRKDAWDDVDAVRGLVLSLGEQVEAVRGTIVGACAKRIGSAVRRFTLAAATERRAAGQLAVPRPARAGPVAAARSPITAPTCGRGCTSATSDSCSTSSRTPTPSRSTWRCGSPPRTRGRTRAGTLPWHEVDGRSGPSLRRGRPEAVDLPVPPGRHRHVHEGARTVLGADERRVELHGQLPHRWPRHRVDQPHLRRR